MEVRPPINLTWHRTIDLCTPLGCRLAVAAFGVLGTLAGGIAGVLITQRRADEREAAAWGRQRERGHASCGSAKTAACGPSIIDEPPIADLISAVERLGRDLRKFRKNGAWPRPRRL